MKSIFKTSVVTVALAGLALVGCNAPADNDVAATDDTMTADETMTADGDMVVFDCPGGETITAQFIGTEEAVVTLPDQAPMTLPATEAASGARYSDGTTTFWNKGDEALVEVDDEVVLSECQSQN
jgi:membrane-bound inhibitor of C-type lysozyme